MEEFDPDRVADRARAALVAYPHKAAAPAVRALRERGLKVVDLSADFRLDRERYERWYQPHEAPELIAEAVYGLPEAHREEIRRADLVAGPGCNSTAALLALLPLSEVARDVVVDIKTGVSGAGREATGRDALRVGHREREPLQDRGPPPQRRARAGAGGRGAHHASSPHLVPIDQGLLASCYVTTEPQLSRDEARALFEQAYADEPFVDLVDSPPRTADVRETNRCRVYVTVTGDRVLAFAAIDNLWKGAAGQAVQDLNLMLGLPETEGLA